MTSTLLTLSLAAVLAADDGKTPERKPHPFAPSLPKLTAEEEEKLDKVIDNFILYDLGKLRGEDGKKALEEFQKLGPEATFALIRGLNRAANIEGSCPAVVIARKLSRTLSATEDSQLLDFARENIGLGVTQQRHLGLLKDLRGGYTAPTPAVDPERVYALFGSSVLAALDVKGQLLWRQEIKPHFFDVALGANAAHH